MKMIIDNIRALRVFVAVVDAGGFTRAAQLLRVAQPAISATIRALEKDVGAELLDRSSRSVVLTSAGARFVEHARAILAHQAASLSEVRAAQRLEFGSISIGAPPMVAGYLLPDALDAFLQKYPGIRVTVVQAGAEEIASRVARHLLDIGLVADSKRGSGLITKLLERHPVVACTARGSRLGKNGAATWADLLAEPLIVFPKGYYQRSLLDEAARRLRTDLNIAVEAESIPLIGELVARGRGVATVLQATAEQLTGVRIVELPRDANVPIAACRAIGGGSAVAQEFERFLERHSGRRT